MQVTFAGYTVPGTLTDFPALVVFQNESNGVYYSDFTSPNGADLRFSTADGLTELSYEIEKWDTNGASFVWVKVPAISNTADRIIAYWGHTNTLVQAYTTNGSTWDTNFSGVWHLPGTHYADSTTNRGNGTAAGTVTATNGPIDGACDFDAGTDDRITVPQNSRYTLLGSYTVSAWIQADPSSTYEGVMGAYVSPNGWIFGLYTGASKELFFYVGGAYRLSGFIVPMSQWKHIAFTRNAATSNGTFYVDGRVVKVLGGVPGSADSGAFRIASGGISWDSSYCFDGRVDEARVSRVERGSNWVWASWLNQASNRTFLAYANVENTGNFPVIDNADGASELATNSAVLNGDLTYAGGEAAADVWLFWGRWNAGTNKAAWEFSSALGQKASGAVSTNLTGLIPDSTYYYTYYASNSLRGAWAPAPAFFLTSELRIEKTADASEDGLTPGSFTVTRAAAATNEDLTVSYAKSGGTAVPGLNYAPLTGTVTLPAGYASVALGIAPRLDFLNPNDTTLELTLTEAKAPIGALSNATMTIYSLSPPTNAWIRANATNLAVYASIGTNWSLGHAPINGEIVYLGSNSMMDMTWDLTNVIPGRWIQTSLFTGVVTVLTKYPGQGSFTNFQIAGDCTIDNGVWTHPANTGVDSPADRLKVTVGGNFALAPAAQIQLTGRGFAAQRGPGAGNSVQRLQTGYGASHGGRGANGTQATPAPTYDSVVSPTSLGSGAHAGGGGNLELRVAGAATIQGTVQADGGIPAVNYGLNPGSAGGSIQIVAGSLDGSGLLSVAGAGGYQGGAGGRIALVATNGTSFGSLTNVTAYGGVYSSLPRGAAGTIYRETMEQAGGRGFVTVDNGNIGSTSYTPLPWDIGPPSSPAAITTTSELAPLSLSLTNGARVLVNDHLRMRDLVGLGSNTLVALNTHSLYLATNEHAIGSGTVASNMGRLVWMNGPITHCLAVAAETHGSVTTGQAGWWNLNDSVAIGATPDTGYGFIRWDGDVPDADRSNATVSLVMDRTRSVRALFGGADPATRTWLGLINSAAGNAGNWYPAIAPATDDRIVLDGNANSQLIDYDYLYSLVQPAMTWDLNIRVASWTQVGYTSLVTIATRYPGQGAFTNLLITGDCVISNGMWTHPANSGTNVQADRLCLTVGGKFILGAGSELDLSGRGFASQRGPSPGNALSRVAAGLGVSNGVAAAHGGRGAHGYLVTAAGGYSPFMTPTNLGSGAYSPGGGALLLTVSNQAVVDGLIDAGGGVGPVETPGSSGGSIYLVADSLSGAGTLAVNGGSGYWGGGGGRLAVFVRNADSFGNVAMTAYGGFQSGNPSSGGAAGTVYRERQSDGPGRGQLIVNNNNQAVPQPDVLTDLPAAAGFVPGEVVGSVLSITNRGWVGLTASLVMRDLFLRTNTATRLNLQGKTLRLTTLFHPDWGHTNNVIYGGGQIVWPATGTIILVR